MVIKSDANRIREKYPIGTRVKLNSPLDDPYSRLKPGATGTVSKVDDIGTIHVHWDCGPKLGLIENVDDFVIVEREEK